MLKLILNLLLKILKILTQLKHNSKSSVALPTVTIFLQQSSMRNNVDSMQFIILTGLA